MKLKGVGACRPKHGMAMSVEESVEHFAMHEQPFSSHDRVKELDNSLCLMAQFVGRLVTTLHEKGVLNTPEVLALFGGEFVEEPPNSPT